MPPAGLLPSSHSNPKEVIDVLVVPFHWFGGPGAFESARNRGVAITTAKAVLPAQALIFSPGGFGRRIDILIGICGAMRLAKCALNAARGSSRKSSANLARSFSLKRLDSDHIDGTLRLVERPDHVSWRVVELTRLRLHASALPSTWPDNSAD